MGAVQDACEAGDMGSVRPDDADAHASTWFDDVVGHLVGTSSFAISRSASMSLTEACGSTEFVPGHVSYPPRALINIK